MSCIHKTAIVNKPAVYEDINIIVAFGFVIPVKIAKALHIQPNFPYSMMGEVLQTRLKIYDLVWFQNPNFMSVL